MKSIVKFKELASKITGFSTPVFGLSWEPPRTDELIAKKVITFLEDRRVLYNPSELETPHYCISSVVEIRHFLTEQIESVGQKSELINNLILMRSACRKFLDSAHISKRDHYFAHRSYDSWVFYSSLGEMRGIFGICISQIVLSFGLDV